MLRRITSIECLAALQDLCNVTTNQKGNACHLLLSSTFAIKWSSHNFDGSHPRRMLPTTSRITFSQLHYFRFSGLNMDTVEHSAIRDSEFSKFEGQHDHRNPHNPAMDAEKGKESHERNFIDIFRSNGLSG